MLKNKIIWTTTLLSSALVITACQPKGEDPKSSADTQQSVSEVQKLVLEGVTETVPVKLEQCSGKNCPEITIDRIKTNQFVIDNLVDQAILKNLQETLDLFEPDQKAKVTQADTQSSSEAVEHQTAAQLLAEQIQPYIDNFIALDKDLKNLGVSHQISLSISPKILNSEGPLATVVLNTSNYLGGAHGSSSQTYFNYDLKKQQQIALEKILLPNQQQKLEKLAHSAFKTWVIDSQLADNVDEYEQAWKFKLTDNYYLGKKGLILQYGEYEIGPYVVGLPRLTIPYENLTDVIKPEYLTGVQPQAQRGADQQSASEVKK